MVAARPAFGSRKSDQPSKLPFDAPERWHDPTDRRSPRIIVAPPGASFLHAVTPSEIRERLAQLPGRYQGYVDVVQLSPMTRKRQLFPVYGLQWGTSVYLYPIESSLVETFIQPPRPQQRIEAEMFGGVWSQRRDLWTLTWTIDSLRDFYLNNILIHEVGHAIDQRNTRHVDRERFANWFAIEYGYRWSRGRH
ncbi:hypothetical protein Pan44_25780 [Caulifigura coniformis]|uniref:Uncharacterized protein n=2 Tax=Caulifigura coniformis TaxID=2527983 RepID=A0A517SEJ5_9PLAN|nr:hypothetical protein Pan44_25780 [Caulifigura coniformis]